MVQDLKLLTLKHYPTAAPKQSKLSEKLAEEQSTKYTTDLYWRFVVLRIIKKTHTIN